MKPLSLLLVVLMTATASAENFGPGTHVVNGLIVVVPSGATITITAPTSVVTLGDGPVTPGPITPKPPADEGRVKRFRDAAQSINEPATASNLMALFTGLAQRSDPTQPNPLYTTPEALSENTTAALDIFLIQSTKKAEWQTWRDLLTDEWVAVAQRGGTMADYSKLMSDAAAGLSRASGAEAFDIGVIFKILEILGDPNKTRLQKIITILPLILTLFAEGV